MEHTPSAVDEPVGHLGHCDTALLGQLCIVMSVVVNGGGGGKGVLWVGGCESAMARKALMTPHIALFVV
jgi:hypothetical protein